MTLRLLLERMGGEEDRESGKDMYTLLYLKWITNKDLLYSTWNSTQCYVSPGWEGVWERMNTCICMTESLCHLSETITVC